MIEFKKDSTKDHDCPAGCCYDCEEAGQLSYNEGGVLRYAVSAYRSDQPPDPGNDH